MERRLCSSQYCPLKRLNSKKYGKSYNSAGTDEGKVWELGSKMRSEDGVLLNRVKK